MYLVTLFILCWIGGSSSSLRPTPDTRNAVLNFRAINAKYNNRLKILIQYSRDSAFKPEKIQTAVVRLSIGSRHQHLMDTCVYVVNTQCLKMIVFFLQEHIMWNCRKAAAGSYLRGNNERSFPHRTDHHQPISVQLWWHVHQPLWQHELNRKRTFVNIIFINTAFKESRNVNQACWAVILQTHAPSAGQDKECNREVHGVTCCNSHMNMTISGS